LIYFTTIFPITQELFFPGIVGTYMNFIIALLAIYFFGALWYIAFQSDPVVVGLATVVAIIVTIIKEWSE